MAYEYDVFLSYTRGQGVGRWVKGHFYPAFSSSLAHAMPHEPKIFVDWSIPSGNVWPDTLKSALLGSRLLVAVISPPYFRSEWCMAEWATMARRAELCQSDNGELRLTHPVVFRDGKWFPREVQEIQHLDLSPWSYDLPPEAYRRSRSYLGFLKRVREFAEGIADCLDSVPEWRADWPIVKPAPMPAQRAELPRLWSPQDIEVTPR